MTAPIELSHITKDYGSAVVVSDVSLYLHEAECVALVGHNGAGKTTLMKLMLGLTRPTTGTLQVLGVDPASSEAAIARQELGFLPENVAFQQAMTGRDVLRFYLRLKRQPASQVDAQLARFVEPSRSWMHFDIYGWAPERRAHGPKGGEAQGIRALDGLIRKRFSA